MCSWHKQLPHVIGIDRNGRRPTSDRRRQSSARYAGASPTSDKHTHMAQLMPLPLTVSCFSKIQIGFTFLVLAHPGSPGKGPLNGCACMRGASAVRRLPSAVCTATPAFHVRSLGLFCSRPLRYQTTCEIRHVPLTVIAGNYLSFLVLLVYTAH